MSRRYYVLVGLDVPGHFAAGAGAAEEKKSAARLVEALLRDALAERDIQATVTGSVGLTEDDVDRMILALRDDARKLVASWQEQKETIDRKLAELSAAVDRVVARQEESP